MKKLSKILSENFKDHGQFNSDNERSKLNTPNPSVRKYSPKKRSVDGQDFFDFMGLVERWGEIVGEGLIPYTHPLKNKNKMLTVLVSHPGFALQLGFLEEDIKSRIFKIFPQLLSHIKKINFINDAEFFKNKNKNENIKIVKMRAHQTSETSVHSYSPQGVMIKKEAELFLSDLPEEIKDDENLISSLKSLFIQSRSEKDDGIS